MQWTDIILSGRGSNVTRLYLVMSVSFSLSHVSYLSLCIDTSLMMCISHLLIQSCEHLIVDILPNGMLWRCAAKNQAEFGSGLTSFPIHTYGRFSQKGIKEIVSNRKQMAKLSIFQITFYHVYLIHCLCKVEIRPYDRYLLIGTKYN